MSLRTSWLVPVCLIVATAVLGADPLVIERVWYRAEGAKRPFPRSGTLTLDGESLEFASRKRRLSVRFEDIHVVSFGTMGGNADTVWAVVSWHHEDRIATFGLREGKKLGYGGRTEEIYETLERALREAGAGQFALPDTYRLFDEMRSEFLIGIPEGWTVRRGPQTYVDGRARFGEIAFMTDDGPVLSIERRRLEGRRSGCESISTSLAEELASGRPFEDVAVDRCSGVRFAGTVAVARGETLYLITSDDEEILDDAVERFRFSAAHTPG